MVQMQIAVSDEHYQYLHQRAQKRGASLDQLVSELIEADIAERQTQTDDPVIALIGAYHSDRPLIDNIPVSEDPDLYLIAEALGERAKGMRAWELAPARYRKGPNGEPVRRASTASEADAN
jgi:hypothetical protein